MKIVRLGKFRVEWCWIGMTLWLQFGNMAIGFVFKKNRRFIKWFRNMGDKNED